jgi:hypothetical protein
LRRYRHRARAWNVAASRAERAQSTLGLVIFGLSEGIDWSHLEPTRLVIGATPFKKIDRIPQTMGSFEKMMTGLAYSLTRPDVRCRRVQPAPGVQC